MKIAEFANRADPDEVAHNELPCCCCCFMFMVHSYGHVMTVRWPNQTIPGQA